MASSRRTWLWVIFGVVLCVALGIAALVGSGIYMVSKHVKTELIGRTSAEEQFARQRERFTGQQPLIEMTGDADDRDVTVHRPGADSRRTELQTLRVLVYDPHEGRIIHVDLPFWLLRLMPSARLDNISGTGGSGFSFESGHLTVDDLERHGPGLVLDAHDKRNAAILIWTE
jgi:hypothetical protein